MKPRLNPPMLLDGATGSALMALGMPSDCCTELWALEHPEPVRALQHAYLEAGSRILYAPTFGANLLRLRQFGLEDRHAELNETLLARTRKTAGDRALVAGTLSPTGATIEPFGETYFSDVFDAYAEQAFALQRAGADLLVVETMVSLQQCRAAILGARQTGLPVFVTIVVDDSGRTPLGSDPVSTLITMQRLGAAAFGINCVSPQLTAETLRAIAPYARIPLIAKPSAGLPGSVLDPQAFAEQCRSLLDAGAVYLGGCCQSTPAHIEALRTLLEGYDFSAATRERYRHPLTAVCSNQPFFLEDDFTISEPIRPSTDMSEEFLRLEAEGWGAAAVRLDTVQEAIYLSHNVHMSRLPLVLVSDSDEALEYGLILYDGCAMIDSRSAIDEAVLQQLAEGYGAVLV